MAKILTYYKETIPKEDIDRLLKVLKESKLLTTQIKIKTNFTKEGKLKKLEALANESY